MKSENKEIERFFSIELESKSHLKTVNLGEGYNDGVLVEGTIGKLMQAAFVEDVILEITGKKGTLRINLEKSAFREFQSENASGLQEVKTCKQ